MTATISRRRRGHRARSRGRSSRSSRRVVLGLTTRMRIGGRHPVLAGERIVGTGATRPSIPATLRTRSDQGMEFDFGRDRGRAALQAAGAASSVPPHRPRHHPQPPPATTNAAPMSFFNVSSHEATDRHPWPAGPRRHREGHHREHPPHRRIRREHGRHGPPLGRDDRLQRPSFPPEVDEIS